MQTLLYVLGIVWATLMVSASQAHAANIEFEGGANPIIILFGTLLGVGWVWRRTFQAADTYTIWYGTNRRNKIANNFDNYFGNNIQYGKCRVSIPKGHVFGSIGSSPFNRWIKRLFSGADDRLKIIDLSARSALEFKKDIGAHLEKFDQKEKSVLIFIHGYNVKFSEAAIRAAQIGFDLKVPGVMALYSWPSRGEVGAYLSDADSLAASEPHLIEFILDVAEAAGDVKINILAHSMGNLGLTRALSYGLATQKLEHIRFGQIFLAAPDIDVNLFRQLSSVYPCCSERTTMYISSGDQALTFSKFVHRNQRTGYAPPVTVVAGIDTIETTNIDVGLLGHGYYAAASALLYDIAGLIRSNIDPEKRPALYRERNKEGMPYFVIRQQQH